ncbi:MAG: hypothetical protein N3G79_00550 [Sulfolobales archaeon]|nr:hypothetical protein [Sulfolobales archaeon]
MFAVVLKKLCADFHTARAVVYVLTALLYLVSVNTLLITNYHFTVLAFADSIVAGSTRISPESYYKHFQAVVDVIFTSEGFVAAHSAGYVFWATLSVLISKLPILSEDGAFLNAFRAMNYVSAFMGILSVTFVEKIAKLYLNARRSLLVAILYALGSIAWVYSTVSYTQSFSAPFVTIGLYYLFSYVRWRSPTHLVISFLLFSIASAADHSLVVLGIGSLLLVCYVDRAKLKNLVVSAAPYSTFLVLALLYYTWILGRPQPAQSIYAAQFRYAPLDITRVTGELSLLKMLLGYRKGLLAVSPAMLLALLTSPLALLKRRPQIRAEVFYLLAVFLSTATAHAAWYDWHGGVSYGPRLLYSTLPLLAALTAVTLSSYWKLSYAYVSLGLLGAILNAIVVATNPLSCSYQDLLEASLPQPLACNAPLLSSSRGSPTLLGELGISSLTTALVLALIAIAIKGILVVSLWRVRRVNPSSTLE